jgi:hypothetical protein
MHLTPFSWMTPKKLQCLPLSFFFAKKVARAFAATRPPLFVPKRTKTVIYVWGVFATLKKSSCVLWLRYNGKPHLFWSHEAVLQMNFDRTKSLRAHNKISVQRRRDLLRMPPSRANGLGDFSPIGRLFTMGRFTMGRNILNYGPHFFSTVTVVY